MKRGLWVLVVLFALVPVLTGCGGGGPVHNDGTYGLFKKHIEVDGAMRRYALYIPRSLGSRKVPLLFSLHGGGIYIEDMTGESGHKTPFKLWMTLAEREGFIVVYPEGLNGSYGKPTWNDCRGDATVSSRADDVKFIERIITQVSSAYPVDRTRIYASGISNGGFMALRLGVERPNIFAAVSAIAAAMPAVSECAPPTEPIAVLFMNGTADNHMPYNGGTLSNPPKASHGTVRSTEASVEIFLKLNGASSAAQKTVFPDLDPNDGGVVERFIHPGGKEVRLYKVNGGGHAAPSIKERYSALFERYFGKQNHDIEMVEEVWGFFKNQHR
ncbi:alpha/beta hydrolase family esterase [Hydrogenimonas sp.]